jgi:hypothetical protein
MMHVDVLSRIKRLVLARRIVLTRKAEDEMYADNLTEDEVIESIVTPSALTRYSAPRNVNGVRRRRSCT